MIVCMIRTGGLLPSSEQRIGTNDRHRYLRYFFPLSVRLNVAAGGEAFQTTERRIDELYHICTNKESPV